jgi:hypothetical protein
MSDAPKARASCGKWDLVAKLAGPFGADERPPAITFHADERAEGERGEREMGFEPTTSTLARLHSTTELLPLGGGGFWYRAGPLSRLFRGPPYAFGAGVGVARPGDAEAASGGAGAAASSRLAASLAATVRKKAKKYSAAESSEKNTEM